MSDIIESLKDVVDPSRREQATTESYDPHTRGPYPDHKPTTDNNPGSLAAPEASQPALEKADPARKEQADLSETGAKEKETKVSSHAPVHSMSKSLTLTVNESDDPRNVLGITGSKQTV